MWDVALQMGKMGLQTIADGVKAWRRGENRSLRKVAIGVSAMALSILYTASIAGAASFNLSQLGEEHIPLPKLCKGWKCTPVPSPFWYCQTAVPWEAEEVLDGGHFHPFLSSVYAIFLHHRCGSVKQGIEVKIPKEFGGNALVTLLGNCPLPRLLPSHPCEKTFSREL